MTCFWKGIISSLSLDDLKILGLETNPTPKQLCYILKKKNKKSNKLMWNNIKLSINEIEENFIHVSDYNLNDINNGYLCSVCDPFLCLLCEILECNIIHYYLDKPMYYNYPSSTKTFKFSSDRGHFWKYNK